jgi:Methyltransferase FkbM domain
MRRHRYLATAQPGSSIVHIQEKVPTAVRLRRGVVRRAKRAVLPKGKPRVRRLPFGVPAGIRYRVSVNGSLYRYLGLFEYEISGHVRRFCRPGTRCWDVGGQDGYYALVFSKLTGEQVVSFEAEDAGCEKLARTLAENGRLGERVQIQHAFVGAVSDGNGRLALDDFPGAPDVLKIDVDGGEYEVLRGARRVLSEDRPDLLIETHSQVLEHQCLELLLDHGYSATVVSQRLLMRENRPLAHNRWIVARHPQRGGD